VDYRPYISRLIYAATFITLGVVIVVINGRFILTAPNRLFFHHVNRETIGAIHVVAGVCLLVPLRTRQPRDLTWAFPAIGVCHLWAAVAAYPFFFTTRIPGNIISVFAWVMVSYGIVRGCHRETTD
jgi:hypothetical protein